MIWISIPVCIVVASFFAGLETGLVSANQFALFGKKEKGVLHARAADFLLLKPERLLSTTLIGTNIAVVTAAVLLSNFLRESGYGWATWIGSISLAVVMLVFSEIVPKSFFRQNADTIAMRLAPVLVFFYFVFYVPALVLNLLVKIILFATGQLRASKQQPTSKQSLRTLVRLGSREAGIALEDQRIIEDIFDFHDTMAREVMILIHRTLACSTTMEMETISTQAIASGVRFVPMYAHRLDNVVGYVDIEEVAAASEITVESLMHDPVFYPDTKRIPDLFSEMNAKGISVAFLSNEYGRISGMITPLEIVNEIVGATPGGTAHGQTEIRRIDDGHYRAAGMADLEDFQNETGISIEKGPYDTIGGFLMTRFGRIPAAGESLSYRGARFVVLDRDDVHVKSIEITGDDPR